jgi:MFS family permease
MQEMSQTRSISASPLLFPQFRWIAGAAMIANFGANIQAVGASWTMTMLSHSPLMVALVQAAASLPVMLLSLAAGAIADNLDRRKVMLAAQLLMFSASVALAATALAGSLSPALLLGFTFVIACGTAINWPAMQVSLAELVPTPSVARAISLNAMGLNIARSLGPAIGGGVISAFGAATAFLLNAFSYIAMIVALLRWRREVPARLLPPERLLPAMGAGIRYAAMSPVIGRVLLRSLGYGLCSSAIMALMPLIARDLVHGGAFTYGLLLGGFGLGAVVSAMVSTQIRARWSSESIVKWASLTGVAGAALAGASHWLPVTFLAMAMAGASWLTTLATFNVVIQLSSPRWVVARALSLYQTAIFGGMAFGSWTFGALASQFGGAASLFLCAAGLCLVALAGLVIPIRSRGDADLQPRSDWRIPETVMPVDLRSGPIVITLEYRIDPQNALRFSAIMQERSRILRRDGARHWSLGRDLSDPEQWIERFHLPTWFDYLQLNHRRTRDDLASMDALRDVLVEGTAPAVHRMIERQSGAAPWSREPDLAMIDASVKSG